MRYLSHSRFSGFPADVIEVRRLFGDVAFIWRNGEQDADNKTVTFDVRRSHNCYVTSRDDEGEFLPLYILVPEVAIQGVWPDRSDGGYKDIRLGKVHADNEEDEVYGLVLQRRDGIGLYFCLGPTSIDGSGSLGI